MPQSNSGALSALHRYLQASSIADLVDSIHVGLPEEQVADRLNGPLATIVSVNLPRYTTYPRLGFHYNRLLENESEFWIDVASRNGNSDTYCRRVADAVNILLSDDVIQPFDGQEYGLYTFRGQDVSVMWDPEILRAWHAVVKVSAWYVLQV